MGAVSFSLDRRLVDALKSALPLNVLIETGTFKGDTVFSLESCFDKVISIELSKALWADAVKRFADYSHVRILQGNSQDKLRELRNELQDQGVLYWLDAHWCVGGSTAGELSQCPLLFELQAIGQLNAQSVVLIDDARLFQAPPQAPHEISQWPRFFEIVKKLQQLSAQHELMIVNDVIAFYPKLCTFEMESYAREYGVDWLKAANSIKENYGDLLEAKEEVILELSRALKAYRVSHKQTEINQKDAVINEQERALSAYRLAFSVLSPIFYLKNSFNKLKEICKPRLGNLNQYVPRPLTNAARRVEQALSQFPAISIATPSFKQGEFIERTLLSVFDQQYPRLEYFVQDGGSKDGTVEVLKKHQTRLSGWASEQDSGQSQAINLGLTKTSGEIMGWLNSDDLLLPGALHTVADYFNRHPDVDVVYGNRLLIDVNDMEIGRWIVPGHNSAVLSWADYVPQETMFWRRRIWEKVGGQIDESFRFAMDWDLLVRFRDAGANFAHIPRFLGAFRIHAHQKTSASINDVGHQEMDRIRQRVLGRVPNRKEIRKSVFPFLLKHVAVDMLYRIKTRLGGRQ